MTTANRYTRIAMVASSNSNRPPYEVAWDGAQLTCPCPGWTRRTGADGSRTCRHVREVQGRVEGLGGIAAALRIIENTGARIDVPAPPPQATVSYAEERRITMQANARRRAEANRAAVLQRHQREEAEQRGRTMERIRHMAAQPAPDPIHVAASSIAHTRLPYGVGQANLNALVADIVALVRRHAGTTAAQTQAPPEPTPDWLGGGRAIILRD